MALDIAASLRHEPIDDYWDLLALVEAERLELGLAHPVAVHLSATDVGLAWRDADGYHIMVGGAMATRPTVRHELLHIADGHVDDPGRLRYALSHEPQAVLYGALGIRM